MSWGVLVSVIGLVLLILSHTAVLFIWGSRLTENVKELRRVHEDHKDETRRLYNDHEKEIRILREYHVESAPVMAELATSIGFLKEELRYIRMSRRSSEDRTLKSSPEGGA